MAVFSPSVLPAAARERYDKSSPEERAEWEALRLRGQTDHMFLGTEVMGGNFQPVPHGRIDEQGRHVGLFSNFLPKDPMQVKPLYALDAPCGSCFAFLKPRPECTVCSGTGRVDYKRRMILWPRGSFKSSAVVVEIIQLILNFPDIRICFLTGNQKLGRRRLKQVRAIFEKPTAKFKALYPEFVARKIRGIQRLEGDSDEFTVPCRTENFIDQPTFCISSAKSINAGSHFDVIFVDDLVNEKNYKNPDLLESCWQQFLEITPLLSPEGFLFVTGTRYSFGDTYQRIRELADKEMREKGKTRWKIDIRTCWVEKCTCGHPDVRHNRDANYDNPPCTLCDCKCFKGAGKKDVLFPQFTKPNGDKEGYTVEFLESQREQDEEWFACQYENNPIASGSQKFTPELLDSQTFYHLKHLPTTGATFIVGDLAYEGNDKRDESVLYVCRKSQGRIFVFHCIAGKWDTDAQVMEIVHAFIKFRPQMMWIEGFNGHRAYDALIRAFATEKGIVNLPLTWTKISNAKGAKTLRVGTIKGVLSQKRLWLFAGMDRFQDLLTQLFRWPKSGRRDDLADCLGLVCEAPTNFLAETLPLPQSSTDWIRSIMRGEAEEEPGYSNNGCGSGIVC